MDALVKEALNKVNEAVGNISWEKLAEQNSGKQIHISQDQSGNVTRAIKAVDALKSALKTLL